MKDTDESESTERRGRGRPPGKRSDPDYNVLSVLVRKDTRREAHIALLQGKDATGPKDLSELVESLLRGYIKSRPGAKPE